MANTPVQAESTLRVIDHELTEILHAKVISGLDALRALAVALVLADHYLIMDHLFGTHPNLAGCQRDDLHRALRFPGHLDPSQRTRGNRNYFPERVLSQARLPHLPRFLLLLLVLTTVVALTFHEFYWRGALTSFFYMMDYGRAFHAGELPYLHMWISWSLAIEEKFNLLWPLLLILFIEKAVHHAAHDGSDHPRPVDLSCHSLPRAWRPVELCVLRVRYARGCAFGRMPACRYGGQQQDPPGLLPAAAAAMAQRAASAGPGMHSPVSPR